MLSAVEYTQDFKRQHFKNSAIGQVSERHCACDRQKRAVVCLLHQTSKFNEQPYKAAGHQGNESSLTSFLNAGPIYL